jgi:hypothetical protein
MRSLSGHSSRRGLRDIGHLGSAHDEPELEALKAAARQRLVGAEAAHTARRPRLTRRPRVSQADSGKVPGVTNDAASTVAALTSAVLIAGCSSSGQGKRFVVERPGFELGVVV